jgi:hypothetical protein
MVIHHIVTVSPPDNDDKWTVACSQNDFVIKSNTRTEAIVIANLHVKRIERR